MGVTMNRTSIVALGVALLTLLPSGVATWASYGGQEPDNHYDALDSYMFTAPPGEATNQVYFNVIIQQSPNGIVAGNSGMLGSRLEGEGNVYYTAILGAWADCNGDGFIGLVDGAQQEYRAEESTLSGHPINTLLCPDLADDAGGAIHNGGGWITELLPIAPMADTDMDNATNHRYIPDLKAKIWGDFTEPVTPSTPPGTEGCVDASVIPVFGAGATGTTGGMLRQVDCDLSLYGASVHQLYVRVTNADTTGTFGNNVNDPTPLYQPGGPLDVTTFGSDDSSKSFVSGEQDCSNDELLVDAGAADPTFQTINSADPLETGIFDQSFEGFGVRNPGSPHANPQGTIAGTLNETIEEVADDCDTSNDSGHDYYGTYPIEGASNGGQAAAGKVDAQMNFAWGSFTGANPRFGCNPTSAWDAVSLAWEFIIGDAPDDPIPGDPAIIPAALCGAPGNGGTSFPHYLRTIQGDDDWGASTNWLGVLPNQGRVTRGSGANTQLAPDAFPADWATFYATVSAAGVSLPHSGDGTYGLEFCTAGIEHNALPMNGWDCDPDHWNLDPSTGKPFDNKASLGTVGDKYQLRDVECYDGTLVSKDSDANPTDADIGGRTIPGATDPTHGCW
jgi:hypothetical protein